jgi:glycosyltransferase involved in cell wall biosynthesis
MSVKTIFIIAGLSTGGAEMMLYKLLAGGIHAQGEAAVISLSDGGTLRERIEELGVPVYTLGMPPGRPTFASILYLRRLVRELRPRICQGWMYHGNLVAALARHWGPQGARVVWNIRHSLYDLGAEKPLTRWAIRAGVYGSHHVDAIIYNSRVSAEQHERIGYAPSRRVLIPNGFDLKRFRPDPETRRRIRKELGIPEEAGVVGMVARCHPMKDHANFIDAAKRLASRRKIVYFVLAGRGVDWKNPTLAALVGELGAERVRLLGERRDVPDLMNAMDVLANPSWSESFPNAVGEALACGVPVVATEVGDTAEIVSDVGIVVPPRDPEVLAKAWERVLEMPEESRRALGAAARRRVKERYSLLAVVDQYKALYGQWL